MAESNDIVHRLRHWAEDDLRAIARDMPITNLSVDTHDVRLWGDLMDEAATEIERLRAVLASHQSALRMIADGWMDSDGVRRMHPDSMVIARKTLNFTP